MGQIGHYLMSTLASGIDYIDLNFLGNPEIIATVVLQGGSGVALIDPGPSTTLHWDLDDPSEVEGTDEERLAAFRRTADEVSARLGPFIDDALRAAGRAGRPARA